MPIYSPIFGQMGMGLKTAKSLVMIKINITIVSAVFYSSTFGQMGMEIEGVAPHICYMFCNQFYLFKLTFN